jgi:hypothetical protein
MHRTRCSRGAVACTVLRFEGHWTSRKLAAELGEVSFSGIQSTWRKHGVRPHRLERHMLHKDPYFEAKAADVIGCTYIRRRTPRSFA